MAMVLGTSTCTSCQGVVNYLFDDSLVDLLVVVIAFLAFASVSPIFTEQPVKEAVAVVGGGEFRMIVDASTGHDPTKSEVHWLAGGEPNQAPIGNLENPFKRIQTCVDVQHPLRGFLLWPPWSTGGRFAIG